MTISKYGTDPLSDDTDSDGIKDGAEIQLGTDPKSTVTDGTPDAEKTFDQELKSDSSVLAGINTDDNQYNLLISANAGGYIENDITVGKSVYSQFLMEDEIYGQIVDIDYSDTFKINSLNISFELKNVETPTDYMIFKYDEDATILLPVDTKYDGSDLTVEDTEDGTYCIANIEEMAENYAQENEPEINKDNVSANTSQPVDAVYRIYIDNNFNVESWDTISDAIYRSSKKLEDCGYKYNITFVFSVYGYSVDISCSSCQRVKEICDKGTEVFNNPNINNINTAYSTYVSKRTSGENVWKDLSGYYSANSNIYTQNFYTSGDCVFLFNAKSSSSGRFCNFNIGKTYYNVYCQKISRFNKMFNNLLLNSILLSPSDKLYRLLTYNNDIQSGKKTNIRRSLFSSFLLNGKLAAGTIFDSDGDGKADISEVIYSKLNTIGNRINSYTSSHKRTMFNKGIEKYEEKVKEKTAVCDIKETPYIPVKSDPTKIDTDGDGYDDINDPEPLKYFDYTFLDNEIYNIGQKDYDNDQYKQAETPEDSDKGIFMSDVKNDSSQYFRFKWCGCGYKIYPVSHEANYKILTLDTSDSICEVKFDSDFNKPEQIWEVLPKSDDSPDGLVIRSKATDSEGNPLYMSAVSGKLRGSSQKNESAIFKLYSTQGKNWLRFGEIYLNYIGWEYTNVSNKINSFKNYYSNKKTGLDSSNIENVDGKNLLIYQYGGNFPKLFYSSVKMDGVCCEIMAAYNAMTLADKQVDFFKLALEFEYNAILCPEIVGNFTFSGTWGSDPYKIDDCLNAYNVSYTTYDSEKYATYTDACNAFDSATSSGKSGIVSYKFKACGLYIRIHTFAEEYDSTKISTPLKAYNRWSHHKTSDYFQSVASSLDEERHYLVGYILN